MSNAKLSAENILIKKDIDVIECLKYNRNENVGYMVFYNTRTKKEIEGGSHYPLNLLYPFQIDFHHLTASTQLGQNFDLLLSDEPIPEEKKKEWERLDATFREREQKLLERRAAEEGITLEDNNEEDEDSE